ncbi:MAG: TolC family protein [Muribaculaceae bacterium]|nr:TolC family protein [Muribaculaceae bacterium]
MNRKFASLVIFSAGLLVVPVIHGNIYKDCYGQLLINNKELQSMKHEAMAEIYSSMSENGLQAPEVEFERLWAKNTDPRWSLSVSQTFEFPSVYNARKKSRKVLEESLRLQYEAYTLDLKLKVTELLVRLSYLNHALDVQTQVVNDMEKLESLLDKAFNEGEISIIDRNNSRLERGNALMTFNQLSTEREEILQELKTIGIYDLGSELNNVNYPIFQLKNRDEYVAGLNNDPLVNYYISMHKSLAMQQNVNKWKRLPEFTIGYVHEVEDGNAFNGFSVGISLPFLYGNINKEMASKRSLMKAEELKAEQARIEREAAIDVDFEQAEKLGALYNKLAELYRIDDHLNLLGKAFKGGQISAIEYIREVEFFRTSKLSFLEVERDYYLALCRLNRFSL